MADYNLFDILERRGEDGFYPLNENHWSNVLTWLLAQRHKDLLSRSLLDLLSPSWNASAWSVDREVEYIVEDRKRRIDIQVTSDNGLRLFIEVKIDTAYQDREQIVDQLSLLQADERFVIVAPLDLSSLLADVQTICGNKLTTTAVTWRSIGEWCGKQRNDVDSIDLISDVILNGIDQYWSKSVTAPFEQMVQVILEEHGWTAFYPDDFKEVFLQRFPDVWAAWVAEKPASGNGNPHQYLMTCLSMLTNRKNGFRLVRTGCSRPPKQADWGYPTIYELSLQQEAV